MSRKGEGDLTAMKEERKKLHLREIRRADGRTPKFLQGKNFKGVPKGGGM